uniref:EamA-like transporter family protein n=1 Tax=Megaviridae environmental sample TaxID=1737588 RepID=A0A5J6VLF4_9VIRU|nr:MAG: EamA-like transporter family protein [Megaviridae environmental sample]
MNWIFYSILTAITGSFWNIENKMGLDYIQTAGFIAYFNLVALLLILLFAFYKRATLRPEKYSILCGITQGTALLFLNYAFNLIPNPGIIMAVFRIQVLFTLFLNILVFKTRLELNKLLFIFLVLVGIYLIAIGQHGHKDSKTEHMTWIVYSIIAAILMSIKDIFIKFASNVKKNTVDNIVVNTIFIQTIIFLLYDFIKQDNLDALNKHNKSVFTSFTDYKYILLCGVAYFLYIYFLSAACKLAKNVGYVKAIDCLGIAITTIAASYLFDKPINITTIIGIVLIIINIILLSIL